MDATQDDPRDDPRGASRDAPRDEDLTGRYLVALGRGAVRDQLEQLRRMGVPDAATSSDFSPASSDPSSRLLTPDDDRALLLEHLGVAVLPAAPEPAPRSAAGPAPTLERERWVRVPEPRTAVQAQARTWGLQALGRGTGLDGSGIRVAVLDTGVDLAHPDLARRIAATTSLVPGEDAQDVQGHGTHCAGTVCGDPSYGVATGAALYAAKVLDSDGRGREADVLAGLEWAVEQGCRVVSMSLSSTGDGGYSQVFEQVAAELLDEGVVLVAAAGNESDRPRQVAPVGRPAGCPSVVAVGAVARDLSLAPFSNGGPRLDLVGPGVEVLSAWPGGGRRVLDGTSMATPHVAGVVACLLQQTPAAPARDVVARLLASAARLDGPREGVGAGLVQRP